MSPRETKEGKAMGKVLQIITLYALAYEANELNKTDCVSVYILKDYVNGKYYAAIKGLWASKSAYKTPENLYKYLEKLKREENFNFMIETLLEGGVKCSI